ncbi:carboxypeptidase A1-like [Amphiura filiformis]|uniref:carboxypeptidase A1-like n=1 Tax=Amphiura filiformis TaxID=82378 RepID=UPI003B21D5CF
MKLLCALLVFVASASAVKNYAGYQVLRVVPQDMEQLQRLHNLSNLLEDTVDFWKGPTKLNRPVDIMIGPNLVQDVKIELSRRDLGFSIYVEDVQTNIDNERCTDCVIAKAGFDYTIYHTIDEISQWVTDFANENAMVTEISIGDSYEGRPVKAVKISSGGSKRVIYIQGGIHAREWISPATMMYMANQLVSNYNTDAEVKAMVDNYDWYIVPSLNVDGYSYTWTNKLGVIRTLFDRMDSIVTEKEDKKEEEKKIRTALQNCGYPRWAMDRVKQQMSTSKIKSNSSNKSTDDNPSKGMVILSYVAGLSEKLKRIFWKH